MDELTESLINEIWKTYPFSMSTIVAVYEKHKSIDKTLEVLNVAQQSGVNPLAITNVKIHKV